MINSILAAPTVGNQIINRLVTLPGLFNYSPSGAIQYASKAYTPININLEILSSYPHLSQQIVNLFSRLIPDRTDYLCGIENGGSYFATHAAHLLGLKVIYLRKEPKIENLHLSRIVGQTPSGSSRICLIDDVLSTGTTLFYATRFFQQLKCHVTSCVIYSYGYHQTISQEIGIPINYLYDFNQLIGAAVSQNLISPEQTLKLRNYIKTFENYLTQKGIIQS